MDNKLGRYRKGVKDTIIYSKYRGFCASCHFTIWVNEKIKFDGKARHISCIAALDDETPRVMDERYLNTYGKVNKKKLKAALKG